MVDVNIGVAGITYANVIRFMNNPNLMLEMH
jgi:hypothetical protein